MTVSDPKATLDVGFGGEKSRQTPVKVVVLEGPDQGMEAPLERTLVIGADPSCDLVLSDKAVSRKHLSLELSGGSLHARDLGSRNGTLLDGTKIREAELKLGSILQVGRSAVAVQPRWYYREVTPSPSRHFFDLLGESVAMREIFAILERVAASDVPVLIEGESGTGKELAARSVHKASPRHASEYVVFDCGSVPRELAESELFGHKKGSFSGALSDRQGAFQRAHGGTLCLDEIGELPMDLQPKLLRVLETGEVRAVGEDVPRKVDVRILASTNRDLAAEVHRGNFRADLYYRLQVVKIRMPALRQRPEDIPVIAKHLLEGKLGADGVLDGPNLSKLLSYSWPGNVRELRNTLHRAAALSRPSVGNSLRFQDLVINLGPASEGPATIGPEFPGVARHLPYKEAKAQLLESFDEAYISALLKRHKGNIQQAAAAAQVSRKHLYEMLRRQSGADVGHAFDD